MTDHCTCPENGRVAHCAAPGHREQWEQLGRPDHQSGQPHECEAQRALRRIEDVMDYLPGSAAWIVRRAIDGDK